MSADNFYGIVKANGGWIVASGSMSELVELEAEGKQWHPGINGWQMRWFDTEDEAWENAETEWSEYGAIKFTDGFSEG